MSSRFLSKRRSRFDLCLDILAIMCNGETKPTRIMYAANLSWNQLHREFEKLLDSDLIVKIDITNGSQSRKVDKRSKYKYVITPKGRNLVKYFTRDATHLDQIINTMCT
ncbi:hypothetical protein KQH65_02020 [archaeon]|nr:hypothetical protein [archaeon]